MYKRLLYLFCGITTSCLLGQNPWQQAKGEVLISPFASTYSAHSFKDSDLNKSDFSNNGKYTNFSPKVYFSIGLKNYKTNIFGNISYIKSAYSDDFATLENNDFGDIEIGVRRHILKTKTDHYLMASLSMFIPGYNNTQEPYVGFDQFSMEGRLYYAGNFKWLDINKNFHKVELGIRYFFPSTPVQIKLHAMQGYRFTKKWVVLGEVEYILSTSNNEVFSPENIRIATDYQIIKPALNLGYEFSDAFSIYAGYFQDIYNKNSAVGHGYQFFAVICL